MRYNSLTIPFTRVKHTIQRLSVCSQRATVMSVSCQDTFIIAESKLVLISSQALALATMSPLSMPMVSCVFPTWDRAWPFSWRGFCTLPVTSPERLWTGLIVAHPVQKKESYMWSSGAGFLFNTMLCCNMAAVLPAPFFLTNEVWQNTHKIYHLNHFEG